MSALGDLFGVSAVPGLSSATGLVREADEAALIGRIDACDLAPPSSSINGPGSGCASDGAAWTAPTARAPTWRHARYPLSGEVRHG